MSDKGPRDAGTGAKPSASGYRPGYQVVAEEILQLISDRGLQAGDRLPTEQELATILQTSKSVAREAVKILSALGRVDVRRGAGLFVADAPNPMNYQPVAHFLPTSHQHVTQLFDYRLLIECESARLAAKTAPPLQVRRLQDLAQASLEAAHVSTAEFGSADAEFHDLLAAAAQNFMLVTSTQLIRELAPQVNRLLFNDESPGPLAAAARQHIQIAEAVASGDDEAAAAAMLEHINTTRYQFEQRIQERLLSP